MERHARKSLASSCSAPAFASKVFSDCNAENWTRKSEYTKKEERIQMVSTTMDAHEKLLEMAREVLFRADAHHGKGFLSPDATHSRRKTVTELYSQFLGHNIDDWMAAQLK
uniref:Protein-serine/threonine kinase n=1 Tax=Haemonchus contortus TaxID=6289 RepID=A0A7I4XSL2_HAECO